MIDWTPEVRRQVFEEFYRLPAREVMDAALEQATFLPPHGPITEVLDAFLTADHAWVLEEGAEDRRVSSIIVRQDLLHALLPRNSSYSQLSRLRHRSLAHGSADCICCFTEGRVLHPVGPDTPCRDILHLVESKGTLHVPVLEDGLLLGEIGTVQLLRAIDALRAKTSTSAGS